MRHQRLHAGVAGLAGEGAGHLLAPPGQLGAGKVDIGTFVDDIVDSAGTLCNAANALRDAGATSVVAYASHGVLSNGAVDRIRKSALEMLVTTDSIAPQTPNEQDRVRRISIAPLLAEAMTRVNN